MRSPNILLPGILIVFTAISLLGCYYDKAELLYPGSVPADCTNITAKFAADVNPIIQNKCAIPGCHNSDASGGLILLTYAQISSNTAVINQRCVVQRTMPAGSPLPANEITAIKCWIESGAPNN